MIKRILAKSSEQKHVRYLAKETENYRSLWKSCKGLFTANLGHYTNDVATPTSLAFAAFCATHFGACEVGSVRFLDVGCGNGRNGIAFAKKGYSCMGVDIAPEAIAIAKTNAARHSVIMDFGSGDFLASDVDVGVFDIVFDSGCFHHLRKSEWELYVSALLSRTHVGSVFFLMVFSTQSRYFPGAMNEVQKYSERNWTLRNGHYSHFFTRAEVEDVFGKSFRVLHYEESGAEGTRGLVFHVFYMERM